LSVAEQVRRAALEAVGRLELLAVEAAATALAGRVGSGGLLYVLGTGHSQLLALEGYYRAGGPAWVAPVVDLELSPAQGASARASERAVGAGRRLVAEIRAENALLVVSNSGRNAVPVEAAESAAEAGLLTLAITSCSTDNRLAAVVDHVLDTAVPPGDAAIEVGEKGARMAPLSTIVGAVVLHALLAQTEAALGAAHVLVSNNVPGGHERNASLIARYPHLRPLR